MLNHLSNIGQCPLSDRDCRLWNDELDLPDLTVGHLDTTLSVDLLNSRADAFCTSDHRHGASQRTCYPNLDRVIGDAGDVAWAWDAVNSAATANCIVQLFNLETNSFQFLP